MKGKLENTVQRLVFVKEGIFNSRQTDANTNSELCRNEINTMNNILHLRGDPGFMQPRYSRNSVNLHLGAMPIYESSIALKTTKKGEM